MDDLYDLSSEDMRMMREYLDNLSGNNKRDMPVSVRGGNGVEQREDVFTEIIKGTGPDRREMRFDTQKAWEKVSARISPAKR